MKIELVTHKSDCAMHNMPAFPSGPCDCAAPRTRRIPEVAVEAAAKRAHYLSETSICNDHTGLTFRAWEDISEDEREEWRTDARETLLAAFMAWPGAVTALDAMEETPHLILPLSQ